MHFLALASDYDGTVADDGYIAAATWAAIRRLRATDRKWVLVTGRSLENLAQVLSPLDAFDRIVTENGAILYRPADKRIIPLCENLPPSLLDTLRRLDVEPLWIGQIIVATRIENRQKLIEAVRRVGTEVGIVSNKDTIMAVPPGVDKATGLAVALSDLGIPAERVVSIGDGENDTPLFEITGCGVAVANASAIVKRSADIVMGAAGGAGVIQLIDQILATDLAGGRRREAARRARVHALPDGCGSIGDLTTPS